MKILLFVKGQPLINGHRRLEFEWNQQAGVYLFNGRALEPEEFNVAAAKVFTSRVHLLMGPQVKVLVEAAKTLEFEDEEMSLAKALDVIEKLAPHRLKKKPGPKPEESMVPA